MQNSNISPDSCPPAKYGSDNVIITWQDNTFFTVQFRDMELKVMGIPNTEEVLDAVKDYVENGEVWV